MKATVTTREEPTMSSKHIVMAYPYSGKPTVHRVRGAAGMLSLAGTFAPGAHSTVHVVVTGSDREAAATADALGWITSHTL